MPGRTAIEPDTHVCSEIPVHLPWYRGPVTEGRDIPFADSLCQSCRFVRLVATKSSVFLMCTQSRLAKYHPQPVRQCSEFQEGDR